MSETPAWLAGASEATASTTSAPLEVSTPTSNASNAASVADDEKDLPSVILMMRLLNIGMAGGVIASAVRISRGGFLWRSSVMSVMMDCRKLRGPARLISLLVIHHHRLLCWSGFPHFLLLFLPSTAFAEAC
jgi:hypothetical protein